MAPNLHAHQLLSRSYVKTAELPCDDYVMKLPNGDLEKRLRGSFENCQWDAAIEIIEENPEIANCSMRMICQGENCFATAVHLAVATPNCPVAVVEALVRANPQAISTAEPRGRRYPIHMGLLKGVAGIAMIDYLLMSYPGATLCSDSTGNVPLHVAVEYASDEIIRRVLESCPQAARCKTTRQRCALHLLISTRCQWNTSSSDVARLSSSHSGYHRIHSASHVVSIDTIRAVIQAYPAALQQHDLQGRLPLHLASGTRFPRWDVLQLLCDEYPEALLVQDENNKIPLQLLKRFCSFGSVSCNNSNRSLTAAAEAALAADQAATTAPDNDIVAAFLQDRTTLEKRKHNVFHKLLFKVAVLPRKKNVSLPTTTTVDLMNCYG